MNNLEKYLDQVIEQKPAAYDVPLDWESQAQSQPKPNVLRSVLKRWYIVLAVLVLVCVVGLPAVWFFVRPVYTVRGAVRVAPVVESILTGENAGGGGGSLGYRDFVNTQVTILTSGPVLQPWPVWSARAAA